MLAFPRWLTARGPLPHLGVSPQPEKSAAQQRQIFMKSVGIEFLPGPVGLTVKSRRPDSSAHVIGFQRRPDGSLLPAEMCVVVPSRSAPRPTLLTDGPNACHAGLAPSAATT